MKRKIGGNNDESKKTDYPFMYSPPAGSNYSLRWFQTEEGLLPWYMQKKPSTNFIVKYSFREQDLDNHLLPSGANLAPLENGLTNEQGKGIDPSPDSLSNQEGHTE